MSRMPRCFNRSHNSRPSWPRSAMMRLGFCLGRPRPALRTATVASVASSR